MKPVGGESALACDAQPGSRGSVADLLARAGLSPRPAAPASPGLADAVALGRLLRPTEQWRLFGELGGRARYLDIETLGLAIDDPITMVGISDGCFASVLVAGRDLTARRLAEELGGARLLVTFAGASFDLPRLRRAFPQLPWDLPHLDLAVLGRQVGLRGGLKKVERALGWRRPPELSACTGRDAVRLWRAYQAGDRRALLRLIRYCRADVASLPRLAERIVAKLAEAELAEAGALQRELLAAELGWLARR